MRLLARPPTAINVLSSHSGCSARCLGSELLGRRLFTLGRPPRLRPPQDPQNETRRNVV